ncbi:MAG: helix-turn-helix domain-containing protein [Candidatus Odinarchaeota archaeon]
MLRYHAVMDSYKLSVQEASKKYGFCRTQIYELRKRWKQEGMTGLQPRSTAPKDPFKKVTPRMEALIVYFKKTLPDWGATRMKIC